MPRKFVTLTGVGFDICLVCLFLAQKVLALTLNIKYYIPPCNSICLVMLFLSRKVLALALNIKCSRKVLALALNIKCYIPLCMFVLLTEGVGFDIFLTYWR